MVLKEEHTTLRFPMVKFENGVQMLVANMPDDFALIVCEQYTLEDMGWNDNHQHPNNYWSRDIIKT